MDRQVLRGDWRVLRIRKTSTTSGQTSTTNEQTNGQTSSTSGKTSTTSEKMNTTSGWMSATSTTSGQASAIIDHTSFASTTRDKTGSAIVITLN